MPASHADAKTRKTKHDNHPVANEVIVLKDGRLGVVTESKPWYTKRSCGCCHELEGCTIEGVVLQADRIERFTQSIPFDEPVEVIDEYA